MAGRTGALEREEPLRVADAALAVAGRAGAWARARLGPGARARLADDRRRNAELRDLAAKRVFEGDLHVVAQIGAALAAGGPAAAPTAHAEQIVEDVSERGG